MEFSDTEIAKAHNAIGRIESLGGTVVWEHELCAVTLSETSITDDDLVVLVDLPFVEILDLSSTLITDKGLHHLYGLGKLETVSLVGTGVTQEGARRLRIELPKVQVFTSNLKSDSVENLSNEPMDHQ